MALTLAGVPGSAAASVVLGYRLLTVWLPLIPGLLALAGPAVNLVLGFALVVLRKVIDRRIAPFDARPAQFGARPKWDDTALLILGL